MSQQSSNILEIVDISKIYGPVKALQNVSLYVRPGEWLAIMGPSGSGKTTLMNIIGCLDSPSLGRVVLDGLSLDSLSAAELTTIRRESIGLIFQQFHLISYLTALENVMVAQYYHSLVDEKEALEALEQVGLADRAKHLPRQLSGGEQQRVCIARALINHPKLLLADEPTGNLDETNEGLVMDILHSLHRQGGTIIVVTHSPEVAAHAERTVVLEHGRVASDSKLGAQEKIFDQASQGVEGLEGTKSAKEADSPIVEKAGGIG
ncbi:MAG: ABC transporter ATP-binding protein [Deltaproteobacteria bacterium]|jgi:putative ABC transport system ATP-binding protein|nr:ABC transporter ATP-binding protein [Deltaproteobacteria bacterium]